MSANTLTENKFNFNENQNEFKFKSSLVPNQNFEEEHLENNFNFTAGNNNSFQDTSFQIQNENKSDDEIQTPVILEPIVNSNLGISFNN